nr:uncharacterized protein LOC109171653 [Ipomoea trifida]GLL46290.1 uncharacterized protein LOC109171653 [Ipomoea trifida]
METNEEENNQGNKRLRFNNQESNKGFQNNKVNGGYRGDNRQENQGQKRNGTESKMGTNKAKDLMAMKEIKEDLDLTIMGLETKITMAEATMEIETGTIKQLIMEVKPTMMGTIIEGGSSS